MRDVANRLAIAYFVLQSFSFFYSSSEPSILSRESLENTTTSTADRLLNLLKTRGPQQAVDAGQALGMTSEAARQQFVKLAGSGLVEAYSQTRGVGRPVQLWQLTSKGHGRFPDSHGDLTVQLLDAVRETFGEAAIDRLIEVREQRNGENYALAMADATSLEDKVKALSEVRSREGYMAQYAATQDGAFMLIENHCPICAAASACQNFCRSELQLFEQVLGARVERIEHLLTDSRRCVYRVSEL